SLAKLPDISVKNVAKILFGQKIINQIETVTGYVGTARYYAQKYKESKPGSESPPRLQGQVIHFGKKVELPKFWVKKIDLSAEAANNLQLSGNMANIVSNQKAIGQPTTLQLGGTRNDQASIRVGAIFDYLSDVSRESINIDFDRIPLSNVKLTDFALLPSKIDKGKGFINAQLNFEGNKFEADIQFTGEQIRFEELKDTGKLNPRLLRISRSLIEAINVIRFQAKAKIQEGQLDFRINSNLDNL
ncbi:MAG: hypothetical protein GWN16_14680, partial [Calditrichae bacterium]|nr:hypothetical protein [Calditrichia bacterium]